MNGQGAVRWIAQTLVRSKIPYGEAIAELRAVAYDGDTRADLDGVLQSWRQVCWGEAGPEDKAVLDNGEGLPARQSWIVDRARKRGRVRSCEVLRVWPVSAETVRLDFWQLCELGFLAARGVNKGRYYIPVVPEPEDIAVVAMPSGCDIAA